MSSSTTTDRDQPSLPSLQSLLASTGTLSDISSFHKDTANWHPQDFPASSAPDGYSHFNMGLQSHSRPAHLLKKIFDRTANDSCSRATSNCPLPGPEPISTSLAGASLTASPPSPNPSVASRASVPPSDGSSGNGSKKKGKRATKEKLKILHDVFQRTNFPSTELRLQLATKLNMPPRSVQIWFQNQRQIIRQNCRADDNSSGLVDGRKRKSSPSDNFSLSMELDEPSSKIESEEVSAQSKKPKSDGEASESWDDSSKLSIPDSIAEPRSLHSLSSSAGTSSWLDHSTIAPILPLPKPTYCSNWTPSSLIAPPASLQHFVSSPSNPAVVELTSLPPPYNQQPLHSQINKVQCVDPKNSPPNPYLPPMLPQ